MLHDTYYKLLKTLKQYKNNYKKMIDDEITFLCTQKASDRSYLIYDNLKEVYNNINKMISDIILLNRLSVDYTSHPDTIKQYQKRFTYILS